MIINIFKIILYLIIMDNFRLSKKKIYEDKRSSIENLHNQKMDDIFDKYNNLEKKKSGIIISRRKNKSIKM